MTDSFFLTKNYSENVTFLLNKESFDALIGSIEEKVNSQASYSTDNYATTSYGYGGQGKLCTMYNVLFTCVYIY